MMHALLPWHWSWAMGSIIFFKKPSGLYGTNLRFSLLLLKMNAAPLTFRNTSPIPIQSSLAISDLRRALTYWQSQTISEHRVFLNKIFHYCVNYYTDLNTHYNERTFIPLPTPHFQVSKGRIRHDICNCYF